MTGLTIGKVARRAGVGIETVRFYERQGLIDEPPRAASGYRHYPEDVVARLEFIRRAKQLGFSLGQIKELLTLRVEPSATCSDVKRRVDAKMADVEDKIRELQRIKRALNKLGRSCSGKGPIQECPILHALDHKEKKR